MSKTDGNNGQRILLTPKGVQADVSSERSGVSTFRSLGQRGLAVLKGSVIVGTVAAVVVACSSNDTNEAKRDARAPTPDACVTGPTTGCSEAGANDGGAADVPRFPDAGSPEAGSMPDAGPVDGPVATPDAPVPQRMLNSAGMCPPAAAGSIEVVIAATPGDRTSNMLQVREVGGFQVGRTGVENSEFVVQRGSTANSAILGYGQPDCTLDNQITMDSDGLREVRRGSRVDLYDVPSGRAACEIVTNVDAPLAGTIVTVRSVKVAVPCTQVAVGDSGVPKMRTPTGTMEVTFQGRTYFVPTGQ
ncbi:hypothetical protein HZC07_01835 [Candidatus Micrarchaeota archaeon]|nr:hypothetical protein [Candidatus Micrarchaeota archaeon]